MSLLSRAGVCWVLLSGCGTPEPSPPADPSAPKATEPVTLRLGYFPNLTHAPALVAVGRGSYKAGLDPSVTLETSTFSAGPAAIEALLSDALDVAFLGPNPAINAHIKSHGEAVRVIAGSTSGGAFLVVAPSVTTAADLKGKVIATPQLGGTQDVAARAWLKAQGFATDLAGGGDVSISPQENAQTLEQFRSGAIAAAWVPEPWATRLIVEAGGHVLVDERDLWPNREYVTVHLLVRTDFLKAHPDVIEDLLAVHVDTIDWIAANPAEAKQWTNDGIAAAVGKPIKPEVLDGAWNNLVFTVDPLRSSLEKSAVDAQAVGLLNLEGADLSTLYSLDLLNDVLKTKGKTPIAEAK